MSKHTYQVTAPDGSTHTRTTARTYTHVVLAQHSEKADRVSAEWALKPNSCERRNFAYYQAVAEGRHAHASSTSDKERARMGALVAGHENAAAYARHCYEKSIAAIETRKAAGYYDEYHAVAWCGRLDLAQNQVSYHRARGWTNLLIQEV